MEALEAETIRQRIATLNDQFRAKGLGNGWLLSQAVRSLDAETLVKLLEMIQQQQFMGSAEGNDAYGEHDFGSIALGRGEEYFWKIDYFDHEQKFHSADPSNPCVTRRVMTVMKADEDEVAK